MIKTFFTRLTLTIMVGLFVLVGCEIETTPPGPSPDFRITFTEGGTLEIPQGQNGTISADIERINGFSADVDLRADTDNFPVGGVTATVTSAGRDSFNVEIGVRSDIAAGTYDLPFIAEGDGIIKNATIELTVTTVTAGPDFMVIFETTEFTVTQGTRSREVGVSIAREDGFSASVSLNPDLTGFPGGVGAIITGSGDNFTIQVDVQSSVAPGEYDLPFIAEGGSITKNYTIDLTVLSENSDTFTVSLDPSSLTIEPGNQASTTVDVSRDGFTGLIDLSVRNVPSGVSTTTTPPNAGNQGSVSVSVGSGASSGTYQLEVVASGGDVTEARTLTLTVPSTGGGSENARIQGSTETDNNLDNYTITTVSAATLDTPAAERPLYVPGELLVKYQATEGLSVQAYRQQALAVASEYELRVLRAGSLDFPDRVALSAGDDVEAVAAALNRDPRVAYAEPNIYFYPQTVPNDPENNRLWHMPISGLPVAWSEQNSSSVIVAVIDSGIDLDHQDLQGVFINGGYDFCSTSGCSESDADPRPNSASDVHGTHVTGTIAAVGNNNQGVAGVLYGGARIVPIKTFPSGTGGTTAAALAQSLRWAVGLPVSGVPSNSNPAQIVNLSLGGSGDSTTVENAVRDVQAEGALLIAASGNAGGSSLFVPARYDDVFAVGSVNSDFRRSCFSNFGSGLDIMAAGGDGSPPDPNVTCDQPVTNEAILSTVPNNNYGLQIGTSHATPIVTGVAALVWEQQSNPTAASVAQALRDSAYFDSSYMNANQYGAGVLRADVALGLLGPTRPGNRNVDVSVSAQSSGDSGVATDTLDLLLGTSDGFEITGLQAGDYTIEADVTRGGDRLQGSVTITLGEGQSRSVSVTLDVP